MTFSHPSPDRIEADVVSDAGDEEETVDGEPVLDDDPAGLVPAPRGALAPATSPVVVQAAAAAATGFVAGAATLALARRRTTRRVARTTARRRSGDGLPVLGTRSFLIDIHALRPGE